MYSLIRRLLKTTNPPVVEKSANPLRFGVIGASQIAPHQIIRPARCHEDAVVLAVAARSKERALEYSRTWNIPKVYGGPNGYQELLDDAEIDAVYIGLPNSLHYEWTMKAIAAGKHVLCDKPIASNETETRKVFALAEEKNLVLLEAWQPRFHPALQRVKEIIDEGSLGEIVKMYSHFGLWGNVLFKKDDIRFDYKLGGGVLMDMGPYPINSMMYLASSKPTVQSAEATCMSENVDKRMEAQLLFGDSLPATIIVDFSPEGWGPFKLFPQFVKLTLRVECENGAIELWNYPLPHLFHSITVIPKNGKSRVEKAYKPKEGKGEEWWSAYRYQLEAFVDTVRGRSPQAWRTAEDSINAMHVIDTIYSKSGLSLRLTSQYQPE
ncbi:NAD(P)-binding protein [Laetiporus sulphureus 93-53]|uniref:D-xylose 1-dehydrogenase (NADP(+), D-xylono-1,5-lactone-forming) n=1 Tax=Laetiporus sulphureus 93-53 TaxID=1314785 RepID=A0A165GV84_9APHY|nr:NAD(P)-binding protein [Laetiporus sulphureus 93-53]KZT10863.1 NAD(P)-binding protein [Laetiporus sulphureus 93-53]